MLLTYKIRHNRDFSEELRKARKVAEFCMKHHTQNRELNPPSTQKSVFSLPPSLPSSLSAASSEFFPRSFSSCDVRHIGLKSTISGPILRKYSRNLDLRAVKNVKLIIPSRAINIDREEKILIIPCLKLLLNYHFSSNFKKISQIEIDNTYAYVAVVFPEEKPESSGRYIGIDRNTKGHIAVVADPDSGKVWKLGKMRHHTYKKYENIKTRLYNKGKYRQLKAVKQREKNIVKDLNHKISRKIVNLALYSGCGIKLENLKGSRKLNNRSEGVGKGKKNKPKDKSRSKIDKHTWLNEYSLNSWSFHKLQQFIEYKSRLQGVEVVYIDPHATSKTCSRCGHLGNRCSKQFECPYCGHVDHADVNAAFNIALTPKGTGQFSAERDAGKGSTDTPQKILDRTILGKRTSREKTSPQFAWEVCQFLA
jgi:putative transposase